MSKPKKWLLDGKPVDTSELFKAALDAGMEDSHSTRTSDAAYFLLTRCHRNIEYNPAYADYKRNNK